MRVKFWLTTVLLLVGCAYYNGLYNANLLVREARKAEREGRVGEARSMWGQVIVKTDTVLARYPNSDYRDDALYLRGMALRELDACPRALVPLRVVADSSPDAELVGRARIFLVRCHLDIGNNDSALVAIGSLADSSSQFQGEALWLRGRVYHRLFNNQAARRDLEMSDSDSVGFDLALVLLALDDPDGARVALETMMEQRYVEERWIPVLDTLAVSEPLAASEIVAELIKRSHLTRGEKARLLISDGKRAESRDIDAASQSYRAAREISGDSVEANIAQVHLSLLQLRSSGDPAGAGAIADELRLAASRGGIASQLARPTIVSLDALLGDTLGGPFADLTRFVVAEMVRDSAAAWDLASTLFAGIARDYPNSAIAPKALIAAQIGVAGSGSLLAQLLQRYPRSPYTLALQGIETPRFGFLEDSLRTLMAGLNLNGVPAASEPARRLIDEEIVN